MPGKENLYFIALIPQKDLYDSIIEIKNDFATRFNSKRALRVMPHITLKAPFWLPVSEHSNLTGWFQNLSIGQPKFQIGLKGFGSFESKRNPVIYVQPIKNTELTALQRELIRNFNTVFHTAIQPTDLKFKPHMTVAYRDLSFEKYLEAWKEYVQKEFKAIFNVSSFHLLQHDTRQWNIIATHNLK